MKRLIAIVTSPRKPGNGELFVRAVAKELGTEWALEIIRLIECDIRPCKACYSCLFEKCPQKDDMQRILSQVISADAVAITAPTYFLGANSLLKKFIDRGLMFYSIIEKIWGKPMVSVTTAGIEGMEGYAKLMVDSAAKIMGGKILASVVVYGAFPGEAVIGEKNRYLVQGVADAILSGKPFVPVESSVACPICGGDSFRFLDGNKVRCMLCSNTGYYKIENERIAITVEAGKHQLFTSLKDALDHAEWLRSMKKRFLEVRNQLKPVVQEYIKTGRLFRLDRDDSIDK